MTAHRSGNLRSTQDVQPVRIVVRHGVARIPASVADQVQPILEAVVPQPERGGRYGYSLDLAIERFYERRRDGTMCIPAGLAPRVAHHLERLGYEVQLADKDAWPVLHRRIVPWQGGRCTIPKTGGSAMPWPPVHGA